MQRLEVSGAVRPIEGSLGVKGLTLHETYEGTFITYDALTHDWLDMPAKIENPVF
jgi:hypothetical protein